MCIRDRYYWRVNAKDNASPANWSVWSSTRSFRVGTALPSHTVGEGLIGGDTTWRMLNDGSYDVNFYDNSGANLDKFQLKAGTVPYGDSPLIDWTDSGIDIYDQSSSTVPWQFPETIWQALQSGGTNYISIRTYDLAGNVSSYIDAFFVLKDTVPPPVPTLLTPADETVTNQTEITFEWSAVSDLPSDGSGLSLSLIHI